MPVPAKERLTALEQLAKASRRFLELVDAGERSAVRQATEVVVDDVVRADVRLAIDEAERVIASQRELHLSVDVQLIKTPRRTCPRCRRVRVLYGLAAVGDIQRPGPLLCRECGGIR